MKQISSLEALPNELILNIILFFTVPELASFRSTSIEINHLDLSKIADSIRIKFTGKKLANDNILHYFRLLNYREGLKPLQLIIPPTLTFPLIEMKHIPLENINQEVSQSSLQSILLLAKKQQDEKSQPKTENRCLVM